MALDLANLEAIARRRAPVTLTPEARERILRARAVVEGAVRDNRVVYGITTGFGNFADVVIPHDRLARAAAEPGSIPRRGCGRAAR